MAEAAKDNYVRLQSLSAHQTRSSIKSIRVFVLPYISNLLLIKINCLTGHLQKLLACSIGGQLKEHLFAIKDV